MKLHGRAHKFSDHINTDYIISGRYKFKTVNMDELASHIMEDIDPGFYGRINPGDFIVAGRNFGCGSSREQAPLVIKHAGISAVLAISFARLFYRNAVNIGLPVVECNTGEINEGDKLEVDLESGMVENRTKSVQISIKPLPDVMIKILEDGGIVEHMKKHGSFAVEK